MLEKRGETRVQRAKQRWLSDRRRMLMTYHKVRQSAMCCLYDLCLRGMVKASFVELLKLS